MAIQLLITTLGYLVFVEATIVPKVFPDYGVLLRNNGPLAGYTMTDVVAFSVSIQKPENAVPWLINESNTAALSISTTERVRILYEDVFRCYSIWDSMVKELQQRITEVEEYAQFEENAETILGTNTDIGNGTGRSRRSLINDVSSTIGGLFSDTDGAKIEQVKNVIRSAVPTLEENLQLQVKINSDTVHEVEAIASFLNKMAAVETCDNDALRYYIQKMHDCDKYERVLKEMSGAGENGIPRVITSTVLKKIVDHQAFNGTEFQIRPLLLRTYGQLKLERIGFTGEGAHMYYLLGFPRITPTTIYPGYTIVQTGFYIGPNCYKLVLAEKMAYINSKFYEIDCDTEFSHGSCKINNNTIKLSCLGNNEVDPCKIVSTACEPYVAVNTRGGLLLTSNGAVSGFIDHVSGQRRAISVNPSQHGTLFMSWGNYSSVILPDGFVIEPPAGEYFPHDVIDLDMHYLTDMYNNKTEWPVMHLDVSEYGRVNDKRIAEQERNIANLTSILKTLNETYKGDSFLNKLALYLHFAQSLVWVYLFYRLVLCFVNTAENSPHTRGRL